MNNNSFKFKHFEIFHNKCAMKVGTDGVLVAAWATFNKTATNILDIGCGSGLISIIAAQRCNEASVLGIDIDPSAIQQSLENAGKTVWKNRINFIEGDICDIELTRKFDLIICNPPFYSESIECPDLKRNQARHTTSMPFEKLIERVYDCMDDNGGFCVILPNSEVYDFLNLAWLKGFYLKRKCAIFTKKKGPAKRYMIELVKERCPYPETVSLSIYDKNSSYCNLIEDIYIKF